MSATQPPPSSSSAPSARRSPWAQEWFLAVTLATVLVFALFDEAISPLVQMPFGLIGILSVLFFVVMGTAIGVVRHAEAIAERLGEPFGTLVLTLSITGIEVCSITAVMLHGENNPDLVRDTLFSVIMIVLGGMIGTALLLGALRYKEQEYNLQGANAYIGVIVPLAVFTLILPDVTTTTTGPTLSTMQKVMVGAMSAGLFVVFLALQTGRHRAYFSTPEENRESGEHGASDDQSSLLRHLLMLIVYIVPVVYLVEKLATPIDYVIETLHAPQALGGVIMAILVATPEGVGGVKSALSNRLQSSINIFLGSVLATIGLTVPVMLVVASMLGLDLNLGLSPTQMVLLITMLAACIITFSSRRTNLMQGAVHLLLFMAFILLLFQS